MASYRWTGATSGVHKLAGNWIDISTGLPAATYPGETAATYDNVYFDKAIDVAGGAHPYAGVTALTEKLGSVYIGGSYVSAIGSAGSPMDIAATSLTVDVADGSGDIYLKGAALLMQSVYIQGGKVHLAGKCSSVYFLKAESLELQASLEMTNVWIGYLTNPATDVALTIPETIAGIPSTIYAHAGTVTCYAQIGTVILTGGVWTGYGNIIESLEQTGGRYVHMRGAITMADIMGGEFDSSTVTAARSVDALKAGAGSIVKLDAPGLTLGYVKPLGGAITWPIGMNVAPV